ILYILKTSQKKMEKKQTEIYKELGESSSSVGNDINLNTHKVEKNAGGKFYSTVWKHKLDKVYYYRVMQCFIGDILKSTKQYDYFVIRKINIVFVQICGVIVCKTPFKDKLNLSVHDGSGHITCLLDNNYFEKTTSSNKIRDLFGFQQNKKDSSILSQATMMTYSALQNLSKNFPKNPDDIKLGDVVLLEGKLSEYNGKLYVFISKLTKTTITYFIENLSYKKSFCETYLS
ncbi:Nucleic acid-binding, partial [Gonioctena quinquepunctata]